MKEILLICPHFMGYDEIIIEELKKHYYNVKYLDSDIFLKEARIKYKRLPKFFRFFLKLSPFFRKKFRENLLKSDFEFNPIQEYIEEYDLILVINGDGVPETLYELIFSKNINTRKILYIWDDFSWLFKTSHIKHFDEILTYNIEDASKYNFSYLPVFTKQVDNNLTKKKYDISIVATANKGRVKFAKHLYEKYKDIYSFYIYFYDKDNKYDFFSFSTPLTYDGYQSLLSQSVATIDIVRYGQTGPTTRIFDSILTKTKIITMNDKIKKYPIYNSNILILDDRMIIPSSFISSEYNSTVEAITIKDWLFFLKIIGN